MNELNKLGYNIILITEITNGSLTFNGLNSMILIIYVNDYSNYYF